MGSTGHVYTYNYFLFYTGFYFLINTNSQLILTNRLELCRPVLVAPI